MMAGVYRMMSNIVGYDYVIEAEAVLVMTASSCMMHVDTF